MLVHVGKIAGMKRMLIIHRCNRARHAGDASRFGELIAIDKVLAAGLANW